MSVVVSEEELNDDLAQAFEAAAGRPIMLHSNILRVGILEPVRPRDEMCAAYLDVISSGVGMSPLLVPTFNYDFCREGVYDIRNSPGQVGVLSDHCRRFHPERRTRTPVFNFCIFGDNSFTLRECRNPFAGDSTFGALRDQDGFVAMLGVGIESATFLHHVEEVADIGYRYIKVFAGRIVDDTGETKFAIDYRVRPLKAGASIYDWPRITDDLMRAGILRSYKAGRGTVQLFRAREYIEFVLRRMRDDEFYLLREDSAEVAAELYEIYGRPLTWNALEAASTPHA
jgi:aminoglycoside N3'-acetyltransferase